MRVRVLVLLSLLLAATVQAKSLYWRELDVNARLDADGRMHAAETQTIVFDGDWNGGERRFSVRTGQSLSFEGITRIENGREIRLSAGNLSAVDQYKMFDGNTLRWRSRLPSDPPFSNTAITYRLDYTISGVVLRAGTNYRLSHDFVFPDRSGQIDHFRLHLELDPAWGGEKIDMTRDNLAPGQSAIVARELTYRGSGAPAGVPVALSRAESYAIAVFFLVSLAALVAAFLKLDAATGRLAPLQDPSTIDERWIEKHLLALPAEVAGASWDGSTGAPEVAAVLARMAVEKKIASEVKKPEGFFGGKPVLHMRLLVGRDELSGYESALVKKLFFDSRNETDTEAVQKHYKSSGLDLAALIKPGIDKQLDALPKWREKGFRPPWAFNSILAVVAIAVLIALAVMGNDSDTMFAASSIIVGLVCLTIAAIAAGVNRRAITQVIPRYVLVGVLMMPIILLALNYILKAGAYLAHGATAFVVAVWTLTVVRLVLDTLRIPDAPETIAFRKTIASAREYFIEQLRSSSPHLRDEWLPWILGFGLGKNVDAWFRSSGVAASAVASHSSLGNSSSSLASSTSGWSGGGGTFGGAGATGAWTVAAGALAAGVAAPGSSGGSGGGGGGSSSGGGGGGGW